MNKIGTARRLICIGGLSSGCGKTTLACLLLKAFPGWAAMKVTPSRPDDVCPRGSHCEACRPPEGQYEVTFDEQISERPGTDTWRFQQAGASHVAFVRALPECLPAAIEFALASLGCVPGVIIESTTAMPLVDGLRILVSKAGCDEVKDSARIAAPLADLRVVSREMENGELIMDNGEEKLISTVSCLLRRECRE